MASPHAQRNRTKSDTGDELRLRAAWIYYMEGETQRNVAAILGVNRITVTRLLSEARRRGEVSIQIKGKLAPLTELQRDLEKCFGLERAIVAPLSDSTLPSPPGGVRTNLLFLLGLKPVFFA